MTVTQCVHKVLDDLPPCLISGWDLHDRVFSEIGHKAYPSTLLKMARDYADMAGAEFICVDRHQSLYKYKPGYKIAGALGGKE